MKKIFHFFLKIVLSPFLSLGRRVSLFKPDPNLIPIPISLSATWSELVNQIRKANPNKNTSPSPNYFLHLEEKRANYDGRPIYKGSFIDPLGNVYSYDHSGSFGRAPTNWRSFKNSIEDNEINEFDLASIVLLPLSQEISRKDLLININNSKKEITKYDNIEINLDKIVRSITRSGYKSSLVYPDTPTSSSAILVYDEIKDIYKRIVLGGSDFTNNSSYISKLNKRLLLLI